jgi:outer membrane receptor for ferrienterochelin and colicin
MHTAYTTPVDSVQEFKMITSPYDAQYGMMAGGVENVILKSGTNSIHGDVYEFARRTWLNANSWGKRFLWL